MAIVITESGNTAQSCVNGSVSVSEHLNMALLGAAWHCK